MLFGTDLHRAVERQNKNLPVADLAAPVCADDRVDEGTDLAHWNNPRSHSLWKIPKACTGLCAPARKEMQTSLAPAAHHTVLYGCVDAEFLNSGSRLDPAFGANDGDYFFQRLIGRLLLHNLERLALFRRRFGRTVGAVCDRAYFVAKEQLLRTLGNLFAFA